MRRVFESVAAVISALLYFFGIFWLGLSFVFFRNNSDWPYWLPGIGALGLGYLLSGERGED